MKNLWLFFLWVHVMFLSHGTVKAQNTQATTALQEKVDYSAYNSLLQDFVNDKGNVDYNKLQTAIPRLNAVLKTLSTAQITTAWSKEDKIAYWINVYNAFTLKLIVTHYPLQSIKDLFRPWHKNIIPTPNQGILDLNTVEHEILRKFNEPRIHFAINCASFSCPKLLNTAYTAKDLETQLEEQTKAFLEDSNRNILSKEKLQLSKIFDWFPKDFTVQKDTPTIIRFINKHANTSFSEKTPIEFIKYNWQLNSTE